MRQSTTYLLLLLIGLGAARSSAAGDGRTEISQAAALQGGVTPGDLPDFPVTLSEPGSYVLTSDLLVSDPDLSGIELTTDAVTIDMAGYRLQGPITCTGSSTTLQCESGDGLGIDGRLPAGGLAERVALVNGTIAGFADYAALLGSATRVRDVVFRGNGDSVSLGSASLVTRTHAVEGRFGIDTGAGSIVIQSVASSNGTGGISASGVVVGNTAHGNGGRGIRTGDGAVVRDNTAVANAGVGIDVGDACVVSDNVANENGSHGIDAGDFSSVQRNIARFNGAHGLSLSPTAAYRENTLGSLTGGFNAGHNSCLGVLCP